MLFCESLAVTPSDEDGARDGLSQSGLGRVARAESGPARFELDIVPSLQLNDEHVIVLTDAPIDAGATAVDVAIEPILPVHAAGQLVGELSLVAH